MLGDGNICLTYNVRHVRIASNSIDEKDYALNFLMPLCKHLFGIQPSLIKSKFNCVYVSMNSTRLIEFLSTIGLKPGNKIRNKSTIPKWIWRDERFLKACLRGLMDTDGGLYELKPHWPGLVQMCFKNHNTALLEDTQRAFRKLGYRISNISWNKIYLTRKADTKRYVDEIGFNNLKHLVIMYGKIHANMVIYL